MAEKKIKQRNVVIEWGDVKRKFLDVVGEGKPWEGPNSSHSTALEFAKAGKGNPYGPPKCNHTCKAVSFELERCEHFTRRENVYNPRLRKNQYGGWIGGYESKLIPGCTYCEWAGQQSWVGGSHGQTLDWLRNGYRAPEFEHSAAYVPLGERKRPTWHDEPDGDLDIGRLYGGFDDHYLVPAEQEKKPGIRVMIEYAFACGVSSKTIEQYGAWVAGLLGALESTGYDLTVDMWIPLDGLFQSSRNDYYNMTRDNVLIRVKRQNEVSDFTDWSALFAPTGYRHVGFCAKMVAGDKIGEKCYEGLGTTLGGKGWGLVYDEEESILKIQVDQRGHGMYGGDAFPKDRLNEQAVKLGLIPEPVKQ
jgi:hypothetical protein